MERQCRCVGAGLYMCGNVECDEGSEISDVELLGRRQHQVLKPDSTYVGMSSTGNDFVEETYQ